MISMAWLISRNGSFLASLLGLLGLGLFLRHDARVLLGLLQHLLELLVYLMVDSLDLLVLDFLIDGLELLHFPAHQQGADFIVEVRNFDVFPDHICHIGQVGVVAVYFPVLMDGLLELGLGDCGLLLVYDVDEQSLLVLACSVLLDVLISPLDVATILFFELAPHLAEKYRNRLLLFLLLDLHCLTALNIPH